MKKYIVSMLVMSFLLVSGFVYAEEAILETTVPETQLMREGQKPPMNKEFKAQQEKMLREAQVKQKEMREEGKNTDEVFKIQLQEKREALKGNMEAKREALKVKLQVIKNEKKQNSVLNISDQIEKINTKVSDKFEDFIKRIESILDNVSTRAQKAEENGEDINTVRLATEKATNMIAQTREIIAVQSAKSYTINITDEANLRETVKTVRDNFHSDIKAVQEQVKSVHEAVREASKALAVVISTEKIEVESSLEE